MYECRAWKLTTDVAQHAHCPFPARQRPSELVLASGMQTAVGTMSVTAGLLQVFRLKEELEDRRPWPTPTTT